MQPMLRVRWVDGLSVIVGTFRNSTQQTNSSATGGSEVSMPVLNTFTHQNSRSLRRLIVIGNADVRFQRRRIGPMPSRIPRALHRTAWPESQRYGTNLLVRSEDAYADTASTQQEQGFL
jgi:hypothetical protein